MTLNNFLYSGFSFNEDENILQFKFKMLNSVLLIVAFFGTLVGLFGDLDINDMGPIHSKVNYIYSFLTILLIFFLRLSKKNYETTANFLLAISFFTFTSTLIFVPQDEFRMIWFYFLIFVAYILTNSTQGLFYTVASVGTILLAHFFAELQLSQVAINTAVLGLFAGSFLSLVYTAKIKDYENSLNRKNNSLNILASTDHLTGIMNRRMFSEIFKRYFQTAQKDDFSLTFLLLDLDYFKNINDNYGHQIGDIVLKRFAETIEKVLSKSDIFARIGGEEFAILISKTKGKDAYIFAESIRREIENILMECDGHKIVITTSIGMTQSSRSDSSLDDIFSRADTALYRAKNEGRNRTCCVSASDKSVGCPKSKEQKVHLNFSI